ncbi:MAG: hypothetical protein AAF542_05415 [Pseudomonadota bacterium]
MYEPKVILSFVIYSGEYIVYQGSFQVSKEKNQYRHKLTAGGEFGFLHSYDGTTCCAKLTFSDGQTVQDELNIETPINRSKVKWKEAKLGDLYQVYYRSALDFTEHSKELRKMLRRSAIARRSQENDSTKINIFKVGSDEDT